MAPTQHSHQEFDMGTVLTLAAIWAGAISIAVILEVVTRPHGGAK